MSFIVFIISVLICIVTILYLLSRLIYAGIKKRKPLKMKKAFILWISSLSIGLCSIIISQWMASTPKIRDENNKIIEGSISELSEVTLNGRKEWISIRGQKTDAPILLFLAGGPGGSQMAAVRHDLAELEKHFIVVNWDQPGAGKSYSATPTSKETYIGDGIALTHYLCDRFSQSKIYLVGESWGSALGIFMIDQAPELYHAFIGTGQMIDFEATEIADYHKALALAKEKGDLNKIKKLEANGLPPYYGNDVTMKSAEYLQYLSDEMLKNPEIHNNGYHTFRDLFSSEYGILDKINYLRGILDTFNAIYPQLYDIDLKKEYAQLNVPVYFFIGRHDLNAPTVFVEEYYQLLKAPSKQIVWFDHSGHSPWINESERFITELLEIKNKLTQ